jgi:ribonuclease BN (tRNA processing enzyme)
VIISHMHQDHFLDLVPLTNMVSQDALRRARRDKGRLPVHVPRGRGPEVLGALALALGNPPTRFSDVLDLREYDDRDTLTLGSLEISFVRTAHPEPCFAPRVSDGSATLVYGADGAVSRELETHARGADLLLVEATLVDPVPELERYGHMTGEQAGELAQRAGVGRLVLTHLSPWIEGQDAENRRRAATRFGGPVDLATEGLRLAVGSR